MSSAPTPSRVANRYGNPKPVRRLSRARLLIIAVLLAAVAAVGAVALTSGSPDVSSKDVGFSLASDGRASVDFEVTKDRSATAQCAVQVLSENYAVVGWKVVTIGPNSAEDGVNAGGTTAHRTDVRTDSPAVSGGVNACWIVED
ncbi:DUF4307 domain-containing protein [Arthrobacter agilis]|uniref:DUF4307 domain-containing protein n=1 Tax=Arthrobacter agilis TaxID=37921 RepID=UPI0027823B74|nr:DUF4307 domain-containing protein [Arthrobacter agilis]MDQ0733975.1 hypothetical protein [Arthrobacter agilis]